MKIPSFNNLVKKSPAITQKLMKLKRKLLIIIMINIFPLKNLITWHQKIFAARLKQANLESKIDIANFVNKSDFHNRVKNTISNKNELT